MDVFKDLETEYTPSMFSKRFKSRDDLIEHYQRFAKEESEKIRLDHDCHLNIAYGETQRQKLDIYGDNLNHDAPLHVFIHGGYWQMLKKMDSAFVAAPLVQKGIRVVVIDYDLCPTVTLNEIVLQVQKAFKWISEYLSRNSVKQLSIAGHSAGAHLLACVMTKEFVDSLHESVRVSAFYISGVYDLQELRLLKAANENNILSLDETNVVELSPQFYNFSHLKDRGIKSYVFVGEFESPKFIEQSRNFAEGPFKSLSSMKFDVLKGLDHFDIVEKLSENDYEISKLISKD